MSLIPFAKAYTEGPDPEIPKPNAPATISRGKPLPPELFQFTEEELRLHPQMRSELIPDHITESSTWRGSNKGGDEVEEEQPAVITGTVGLTASALASSKESGNIISSGEN